jgi:hypothetical protein
MSSRTFRRTALSAVLTAAAATAAIMAPWGGALAAAPDASPVPQWATDGLSMIHPGVVTVTKNQSCTSNFVFLDEKNNAYLGQAAHCSGTGNASETNGCSAKSLPLGTPVTLGASGAKGKMVYNSWLAMQEAGETDKNACADNDFALVSIPKSALSKVNPTIPVFGGPTGLRSGELKAGEAVLSYGNSPLRGGLSVLSPKQGVSLGTERDGWGHTVYTATPGVPGDSGSGFFDAQGRAFGVLSTLSLAPLPASNGVADLAKCLEYASKHSGIKGLRLANGTKPFAPSLVPAAGGLLGGGSGPAPISGP